MKLTGVENIEFKLKALGLEYRSKKNNKEFLPIKGRQFSADFYIPSLDLLIEFEGVNSKKSRHTTLLGYTKDCEKYNLMSLAGYKLLRYTIINVHNLEADILALINKTVERRMFKSL